jgi:hypothetical protein
MSFRQSYAAWRVELHDAYERNVLLYIAEIANDNGSVPPEFIPSVSTIAERGCMSLRKARDVLKYLSGGELDANNSPLCTYLDMTKGAGKKKDMYQLHLPACLLAEYDKKHQFNQLKRPRIFSGYNNHSQISDAMDRKHERNNISNIAEA